MVADLLLRCLVTGLLVLSGVAYAVAAVSYRRLWTSVVSNGLHAVMAIAMTVMIWPGGTHMPTTGPAAFFLLTAVWFVALTVFSAKTIGQWAAGTYHALMMVAMAWMYTLMNGELPGSSTTPRRATHDMSMMPGMDMSAGDGAWTKWASSVNWSWFLVFTVAAVVLAFGWLRASGRGVTGGWRVPLARAGRASMAAAMAIVFATIAFGH